MRRIALGLLLPTLLPALGSAQRLDLDPTARIGSSLSSTLAGSAGTSFLALLDLDGTERNLLGQRVFLGLGPSALVLAGGALPPSGSASWLLPVPNDPTATGIPIYAQGFLLFPTGLVATNGASTAFHESASAIALDFADALADGFTGDYDATVRDRLQGAAARHRLSQGAFQPALQFDQGIVGALNPYGVREQVVFRAVDLGATGRPEQLVAIRWRPFGRVVRPQTFPGFVLDVSHSDVVPDFTIDPISLLPLFPTSGLTPVFASNPRAGENSVRLASGAYAIDPARLRPDGYFDFPLQRSFDYDGVGSLLLDFQVDPAPVPPAGNGQQIQLMVLSAPWPYARAARRGSPGVLVDPRISLVGMERDSALYDYQFEFVTLDSEALSPFLASPRANPDYQPAIVAASIPSGTAIELQYRGADDALGTNPTTWNSTPDIADGRPYLQFRARFRSAAFGSGVPSIDSLIVPID